MYTLAKTRALCTKTPRPKRWFIGVWWWRWIRGWTESLIKTEIHGDPCLLASFFLQVWERDGVFSSKFLPGNIHQDEECSIIFTQLMTSFVSSISIKIKKGVITLIWIHFSLNGVVIWDWNISAKRKEKREERTREGLELCSEKFICFVPEIGDLRIITSSREDLSFRKDGPH